MTSGSVSYDSFTFDPVSGSYFGNKGGRTWSGTDTPRSPRVPATFYTILREEYDSRLRKTVVRAYKVRRPGYTPKRVYQENNYSKSSSITRQYPVHVNSGYEGETRVVPDYWYIQGMTPVYESLPTLFTANDQIKLVNKLREKLQGSDFNMSVFLGEGHQTLRLLGDSAIRIAKSVHYLRSGDVAGTFRSLFEGTTRKPLVGQKKELFGKDASYVAKNASSIWLEIQYGWLPLLNDAEECAKSLAHALNVPFKQTYRAARVVEREFPQVAGTVGPFSDKREAQATHSHVRSLIARVAEKPSVLAQLGLLDPELVAWELVPFSFVADWFIPIGQWMEARGAASRLTGTFITSDKRLSSLECVAVTNQVKKRQLCKGYSLAMSFSRSISTTLAVPMPTLKPLEKVASWRHCANAIALVTQSFAKTVRSF